MVCAQNVWSFIFQEKYAGYQELLYQMNVYVFRFDPELFICFNFSSALNLCLSCFSFVRLECDIAYKWLTCICRSVSRIVLRNAYTKMFWSINFGSAENEISFTVALNIPCVCLRSTNGGAISTMQIGLKNWSPSTELSICYLICLVLFGYHKTVAICVSVEILNEARALTCT